MTMTDQLKRRTVATEKVIPLVAFLRRSYGSFEKAAKVIGVNPSTMYAIQKRKNPRTRGDVAAKIANAVTVLRHGDRTWSLYENDVPRRLANEEDSQHAISAARWRPAAR